MANVPNGVETLPKISIAWRQTTDGRTTYSERERDCKTVYSISMFARVTGIKYAIQGPPIPPFRMVQFYFKPTGLTAVKLVEYCSL